MPLTVERERFFVGLMGLGVNNALLYPNYFAMIPTGTDPNAALTEGFFALAAEQTPRPETVALVSADAEFSRNPVLGAKANAEKYGIQVVHEATYPLSTEDFCPVIDAVAQSGSDLLFLCSYLADSVGLARTIRSHHFRPKMVGGAMSGPQNTAVRTKLGTLLNGFVNYEYWAPVPKMMFPGVEPRSCMRVRQLPGGPFQLVRGGDFCGWADWLPGCRVGWAPVPRFRVWWVLVGTGRCRWSAGVRQGSQSFERVGDHIVPGPVAGQAEDAAAAGRHELSGGGEQS